MTSLKSEAKQTSNETSRVSGEVKWFDPLKGFGFVLVPGFDVEFLLHRNVLVPFGRANAAKGAVIEFYYSADADRPRVEEILSIKGSPELTENDNIDSFENISEEQVPARVKWFDAKKGYGFVHSFGSLEDIFIGSSVLERNGLQELTTGQAVCIQLGESSGRKRVYQIHDWPVN